MESAQSKLAAAHQQSGEIEAKLEVAEGNCTDLRRQLAAVEQEREGFRSGHVRACELEGAAPQLMLLAQSMLLAHSMSASVKQRALQPAVAMEAVLMRFM